MANLKKLESLIKESLNDIRPYLQEDGGDISLVEVTPELKVIVELHGACSNCSMSRMTMKAGVEEAIKRVAPEIVAVEAINEPDPATATPFGQ